MERCDGSFAIVGAQAAKVIRGDLAMKDVDDLKRLAEMLDNRDLFEVGATKASSVTTELPAMIWALEYVLQAAPEVPVLVHVDSHLGES